MQFFKTILPALALFGFALGQSSENANGNNSQVNTNRTSLHVTVTVHPKNATKLEAWMRWATDLSIREPENTFWEVIKDPAQAGRYRFVSAWTRNADWIDNVWLAKPYMVKYFNAVEPMYTKDLYVEVMERMPNNAWISAKPQYFGYYYEATPHNPPTNETRYYPEIGQEVSM